jgi:hypothetical protein
MFSWEYRLHEEKTQMSDYGRLVEQARDTARLGSGIITSPQAFIDLTLPPQFSSFKLLINAITLSVASNLVLSVSLNGGSTFINDHTNYDSYRANGVAINNGALNAPNSYFTDAVADLGHQSDTASPFGINASLDIFPGSPTTFFNFLLLGGARNGATWGFDALWEVVNPAAIVPPVLGRVTTIRLQPYGNGDVNPPTSAARITGGSYVLSGVPS